MRALVLMLVMGALASGCLRTRFDLCAQDPPDPACAYLDAGDVRDAGIDGGADAGSVSDAGSDADVP